LSSAERDRIVRACLDNDDTVMCADDFFKTPIAQGCKEIVGSREFSEFAREFLEDASE
jgi:hypothetical protein